MKYSGPFLVNLNRLGVPKPGCYKPGCLQFLRGNALLCSFAPFCALLRSFADLRLRSFALICALFALICVFLRPTAFRTTAFGNSRVVADIVTELIRFEPEVCICNGNLLEFKSWRESVSLLQGFSADIHTGLSLSLSAIENCSSGSTILYLELEFFHP